MRLLPSLHRRLPAILLAAGLLACGESPRDGREAGPAGPQAEPAAAPAPAGPVALSGRLVQAGTGDGVAGAYFIVLRPGVGLEEWDAASGTDVGDLMAAAVVSDSTGHYRVPALARGYDYTVMVAAEGYQPAVFDAGLTVEPDAPALKEMDPVELEPSIW